MPLSASLILGNNPQVLAGAATNFVVGVTNTNPASVVLNSLSVNEVTESDAQVSQPVFVTPNVAPGVGNPVLAPSTTTYFPFQVVFNSPMGAGPSPQNAPGGASPSNKAMEPDAFFTLQVVGQTSDGSVFSSSLMVPALSAIAPFPLAQGGAFQLSQGANLVNLLVTGL